MISNVGVEGADAIGEDGDVWYGNLVGIVGTRSNEIVEQNMTKGDQRHQHAQRDGQVEEEQEGEIEIELIRLEWLELVQEGEVGRVHQQRDGVE